MNKGKYLRRRSVKNPVIREYELAVKRGSNILKRSWHVVKRDGVWVMKKESDRSGSTFNTQSEAINEAKKIARHEGSEIFIHSRDGRIRERNSYDNSSSRS